ncbi:MAG: non-canonical purine NTP pyrophosphatase, RdgB/HAM1 family [Parcubacteria group bacterium QH_9_35_7]|nr:MAG: non-canonical purine NTP pyrophosphatase, RdgB/HAM1 family [Parcubacteria group bacterium QH_9_35_7]
MDILLGTTNPGKVKEMKKFLTDFEATIYSLDDINKSIKEPNEPHETIEENAFLKARYYAKQTDYITISDDGGLFINALNGWPGVKSARVADSEQKRRQVVLKMLEKKDFGNRKASFKSCISVYDPNREISFSSVGETKGKITEQPEQNIIDGFGFDPIFYVNKANKTYAAMTSSEKNRVSHRGKALSVVNNFFNKFY